MNLLTLAISADHMDAVFAEIIKKIKPSTCAVSFFELETIDRFPQTKALADYSFSQLQCVSAHYDSQIFHDELPPLDPEIIQTMLPYERDILFMLTRWKPFEYRLLLREYYKHLRYWNYILDKLKINICLFTTLPHVAHDIVIYYLCRAKNIPVVFPKAATPHEYICLASEIKDPCPALRRRYEELKSSYKTSDISELEFNDHRIKEKYAHYMNPGSDLTPSYTKAFRESQRNRKDSLRRIQQVRQRLGLISYLVRQVFRFKVTTLQHITKQYFCSEIFWESDILFNYYNKISKRPADGDKYIYVPLHMQPELTTSPLGGVFSDQLLMIRMLSYYLPEGYFLYVKEHPGQGEWGRRFPVARHLEFYQDLAAIKNVKLIDLDTDTYSLINNAQAVATVTGTAGFEAIIKGKPFLMFGFHITQYAPGVTPIRRNEDCAKAVQSLIENPTSLTCSAKDFKLYLKALEETCFYGTHWFNENIYATLTEQEKRDSDQKIIDQYISKIEFLKSQSQQS